MLYYFTYNLRIPDYVVINLGKVLQNKSVRAGPPADGAPDLRSPTNVA